MKKSLIGLLATTLLATSLAACNKNASNSNDIVGSVFNKLATSTLAVRGDRIYFSQYGEDEPYQSVNDTITSVLEEDYYFFGRSWPGFDETSYTRYDRGPGNEALIVFLDPLSNELMANVVVDLATQTPVSFDDAFANPFKKSLAGSFRVKKGAKNVLEITDASALNYAYLFNTVFGGQTYRNPLLALEIGYDKNYNPTSLYIEFGRIQDLDGTFLVNKDIFDGAFIDSSTVNIPPVPTPRQGQPGQEKLQTMFDSLKNMNYTVEEHVLIDYTPYGEDFQQDYTIKTYLNPDGYYYEFSGDWGEYEQGTLGRGEVETPRGLLSYKKTADGFEITNLPKPMRTVKQKFGNFWTYSARSFDVHEDGSYTLAQVDGFAAYLWTNLMTDGTISGPAMPNNIRFTIDEAAGTLSYTYSDEEGIATVSSVVKAIGSTTLPIDLTDAKPFTYSTTWEAWYHEDENWHKDTYNALNILTNNHPEMIPYIYSPYEFERSVSTEGDYEFIDEPPFIIETITSVNYFKSVYQYDSCEEVVNAFADATEQARAGSFTFDHGLVVDVKNLNAVPSDPLIGI